VLSGTNTTAAEHWLNKCGPAAPNSIYGNAGNQRRRYQGNCNHNVNAIGIIITGGLELCFGGDKPTKDPPWWLDCVAKLQLAFQCNWLGKVCRLCNMSSLQEKICQTFCLQAWQGPKWYNAFKCLLCFEAKSLLGLFCLHLNTIGWSSHMTSIDTQRQLVVI